MGIKQYLDMKAKERRYLRAVRAEAEAYLDVSEAADNILKLSDGDWCFDDYPVITSKCTHFREDCACAKTHCPLHHFNNELIYALRAREAAHINMNLAQTAVLAAKVRG